MKILIVGLGSIAKKHVEVIRKIEPGSIIFALRAGKGRLSLPAVTDIFALNEIPQDLDFIIISNPTSKHLETIKRLAFLKKPLFIEKPPFSSLEGTDEIIEFLKKEQVITYTAFNFRFHPVIQWIRKSIKGRRVLEVQAYCGSYLPSWRHDVDYRSVYSANKELGGGVHLDLIHELDYVSWLFGYPSTVKGHFSKISDLELDVPDVAHYWLEYENMVASITLNYYRKDPKRTVEIVLENDTWNVNLLTFEVVNSTGEVLFQATPEKLITYEEQMRYFITCIQNGEKPMNGIADSVKTLELCLNNISE